MTLNCNVEDPGRPATTSYRWTRGSHSVPNVTSAIRTIDSVSLETKGTFTCLPFNSEGEGAPGSVTIDVLGKPQMYFK